MTTSVMRYLRLTGSDVACLGRCPAYYIAVPPPQSGHVGHRLAPLSSRREASVTAFTSAAVLAALPCLRSTRDRSRPRIANAWPTYGPFRNARLAPTR